MSNDIPSPCIRNCCLDTNDVCLGCFRYIDEITSWGNASNQQKQKILENADIRKQKAKQKPNL